jgi:hypothetical protein
MRTVDRLSDIELINCDGRMERLGSLWEKKPAVLVFIRHFG